MARRVLFCIALLLGVTDASLPDLSWRVPSSGEDVNAISAGATIDQQPPASQQVQDDGVLPAGRSLAVAHPGTFRRSESSRPTTSIPDPSTQLSLRCGAYVVLGNPFKFPLAGGSKRTSAQSNDRIFPSENALKIHLWALTKTPTSLLSAIIAVVPTELQREEFDNYTAVGEFAARLAYPVAVVRAPNNTMGSYGMYLHAFTLYRSQYDFYIFTEVDYVPLYPRFAEVLSSLLHSAFNGRPGMLAGVLVGGALEPPNRHGNALHAESSHVMSTRSLDLLFRHVYETVGWKREMADYMVHLVAVNGSRFRTPPHKLAANHRNYHIQEGWGLLMLQAGLEVKDWTSVYRTPYWGHSEPIVDFSGSPRQLIPMNQVLFAPMQMPFVSKIKRCCRGRALCSSALASCFIQDWRTDTDCCPDAGKDRSTSERRGRYSIPSASVDQQALPYAYEVALTCRPGKDVCSLPESLMNMEHRAYS